MSGRGPSSPAASSIPVTLNECGQGFVVSSTFSVINLAVKFNF